MNKTIKLFFTNKKLSSKLLFMFFLMMAFIPNPAMPFNFNLEKIQIDIEEEYPHITHINGDKFSKLDKQTTIVFDVREKEEFNVSHIENAIQIAPDINSKKFINQYSSQLKEKHIVFYCSVGRRSSALASRLKPLLAEQGVQEIYNLKGGIFLWHNQNRTLVQQDQPTQFIHPFNGRWGKLLKNSQFIKFSPGTSIEKTSK